MEKERREQRPLSKLSKEFLQYGWKLRKSVEATIDKFEGTIEFSSIGEGKEFISDKELSSLAVSQGSAFGQEDAEWLFEHQEMLSDCPPEVRYLMFPGTEWEHPNGVLLWPYLHRKNNKEWGIYAFWRDFGFPAKHTRLIRFTPKNS